MPLIEPFFLEINLMPLIKPFFLDEQKVKKKKFEYLESRKSF